MNDIPVNFCVLLIAGHIMGLGLGYIVGTSMPPTLEPEESDESDDQELDTDPKDEPHE